MKNEWWKKGELGRRRMTAIRVSDGDEPQLGPILWAWVTGGIQTFQRWTQPQKI